MKLRRIKSHEDLSQIAMMLKAFYEERPDVYGLMDRDQAAYDAYANVIRQWTVPQGKVLDLGCGTYRTPLLIQQRGFETTGCDIFTEEKLQEYREKLPNGGPKLVSFNGLLLPFEDNVFDAVSTLCVFEHIPNVEAILHEINRVLKPGGRIIIIGPNLSGPHRAILGLVKLLHGKGRYWQLESIPDCLFMLFRSLELLVEITASSSSKFIYVFPVIKNGKIYFEQPDDDAIHLNCPLSYKKWFERHGFVLNQYNNAGTTSLTRAFNRVFPSLSTIVQIVAQKRTKGVC